MPETDILERATGCADAIITLRRAIHAEPEIGLDNPLTRDKVRAALADLPIDWREGTSTTGLVGRMTGTAAAAGEDRRVLLRGDTDALPLTEATGLPFASTIAGRMHACGHDTHVAMLAGAARVLAGRRDQWAGEVVLMFQPGEEGFHGARFMIDDGLIDPLPDAAFALHIMPDSPYGLVAGRAGPLLASADRFEITVRGQGGHASMPHLAADPMPVAAEIVMAVQAMVTRRFPVADPVVVTVSEIHAGTAHNVIPDTALLRGTMRTLSRDNRTRLHAALTALAQGIAGAHGIAADVQIFEGFPVTVCDPRAVDLGESVAQALGGPRRFHRLAHPIMGAEDFSYVLDKVPGAMFFLGVAADGVDWKQCCGIHSPRMMVDETALPFGAALLAGCAERFLARGFG